MRWLRRFLYSDDPVVKLAAALTEPEAELRRELLANEGVVALIKSTGFLSVAYGSRFENDHDLYVRESDVERAEEILAVLREPGEEVAPDESWEQTDPR